MRRISLVMLGIGLVIWTRTASAQLSVQEVGLNLAHNAAQAADAVVNTFSWGLNLAGIEFNALNVGTLAQDLATIRQVIADGQRLAWDASSLQAQIQEMFNLDGAPFTSDGLRARMAGIQELVVLAHSYAMRTQTLINTSLGVLADIEELAFDLQSILGVVNGTQVLAEQQSRLLHLQAELKVQTTAFERAVSTQAIADPILERGVQNFNETVWATEP